MDISSLNSMASTLNSAQNSSSTEKADSLNGSLKNLSKDSSEEELKGVIKDFESYFLNVCL